MREFPNEQSPEDESVSPRQRVQIQLTADRLSLSPESVEKEFAYINAGHPDEIRRPLESFSLYYATLEAATQNLHPPHTTYDTDGPITVYESTDQTEPLFFVSTKGTYYSAGSGHAIAQQGYQLFIQKGGVDKHTTIDAQTISMNASVGTITESACFVPEETTMHIVTPSLLQDEMKRNGRQYVSLPASHTAKPSLEKLQPIIEQELSCKPTDDELQSDEELVVGLLLDSHLGPYIINGEGWTRDFIHYLHTLGLAHDPHLTMLLAHATRRHAQLDLERFAQIDEPESRTEQPNDEDEDLASIATPPNVARSFFGGVEALFIPPFITPEVPANISEASISRVLTPGTTLHIDITVAHGQENNIRSAVKITDLTYTDDTKRKHKASHTEIYPAVDVSELDSSTAQHHPKDGRLQLTITGQQAPPQA